MVVVGVEVIMRLALRVLALEVLVVVEETMLQVPLVHLAKDLVEVLVLTSHLTVVVAVEQDQSVLLHRVVLLVMVDQEFLLQSQVLLSQEQEAVVVEADQEMLQADQEAVVLEVVFLELSILVVVAELIDKLLVDQVDQV
jgi:hypothetical protein